MRPILLIAAKTAVSVGLFYFALTRTDFSAVIIRLHQLDVAWCLLALSILGFQLALVSVRWRVIAQQCGTTLALPDAFRLNLVGAFFSQVLPSTVGGDAVRIWILAREGAGWVKAAHSVLLDRFVGVLALALLVVICLPWTLELVRNPIGQAVLLMIGCGNVAAGLAFIAFGSRRWSWMQRFWATRQAAQLAATALELFKSARRAVVLTSMSLVIHLLTAAIAWSVARAATVPFDFAHSLLLVPPVVLVATIPISIAGWGVRESALVLAFAYAGLSESDGLVVSILFGAAYFAVGTIGGAVWLFSGRRLRSSTLRHTHPTVP
jgi:uncharacterized protein (TIRG00374 family)